VAIFHASTKSISRSAGRSAVAAIAYRTACRLVDERTGQVHDYTRKGGVVSTEILLPDGSSAERNALWNAAEAAEKRKDARTAREWVIALPSELDAQQRQELAVGFGIELATRYGVAVDLAIHLPDHEGDNRNHHAHILTTTRQVHRDESGALVLGKKAAIELSDRDRRALGLGAIGEEITAVRKLWEQTANRALEQAGRAERIDARSLKAQGIDREATRHMGPSATEMERRGIQTDRGDLNRQTATNNQERVQLVAEVIELQAQRQRKEQAQQEARREKAAIRRERAREARETTRRERFEAGVRELEEAAKQWQAPRRVTPQAPAPPKPAQRQAQATEPEQTWTNEQKDSLVRIVMAAVQQYRLGAITVEQEGARKVLEAIAAYPGKDKDRMARMRETLEGPGGPQNLRVLHTTAWQVKPELERLAQEQQRQQQRRGPEIEPGGPSW
jgi:hypothetical protein